MTKSAAKKSKKDLTLQKKDLLTPDACRSFNEQIATFTSLPFLFFFMQSNTKSQKTTLQAMQFLKSKKV